MVSYLLEGSFKKQIQFRQFVQQYKEGLEPVPVPIYYNLELQPLPQPDPSSELARNRMPLGICIPSFPRDVQSKLDAREPCVPKLRNCHDLSISLSCFGVLPVLLWYLSCFSPCQVSLLCDYCSLPDVSQLLLVACPVCVWYLSPCLSFVPCRIIVVCGEFCPVCSRCSLCYPRHPCSLPF
ncbi:unnamed protein product [Arctogadus glacialis]